MTGEHDRRPTPAWQNIPEDDHATRRSLAEPETLRQARRHYYWTNRYIAAQLCYACAAQAGYGHQHGFHAIRPPCHFCRGIVANLPLASVNGWRKLPESASGEQ